MFARWMTVTAPVSPGGKPRSTWRQKKSAIRPARAAVVCSGSCPQTGSPHRKETEMPTVKFTLAKTTLFGQMTNKILVDGREQRTIQMGETVDLEVPPGKHVIQLVLVARSIATLFIPIKRKSNVVELTAEGQTQSAVLAEYDRIWGKYKLRLG
jgi:hypothetical protein